MKLSIKRNAILFFILISTLLSTNLFAQSPTISVFSPTSASSGTSVIISGK